VVLKDLVEVQVQIVHKCPGKCNKTSGRWATTCCCGRQA